MIARYGARLGASVWIVGPVGYLVLEAIAAAAFRDYSYANNYISDLGLTGPRTRLMQLAFCMQGILFLLGATLISGSGRNGRHRFFLGLAVANAVGNCLVGTVHRGGLHAVGALLAILGGNAAVLAGWAVVSSAAWYRNASTMIAALGFLCFLGFAGGTVGMHVGPKGLWERGSVYSILLWQMLTACWVLLGHRNRPDH